MGQSSTIIPGIIATLPLTFIVRNAQLLQYAKIALYGNTGGIQYRYKYYDEGDYTGEGKTYQTLWLNYDIGNSVYLMRYRGKDRPYTWSCIQFRCVLSGTRGQLHLFFLVRPLKGATPLIAVAGSLSSILHDGAWGLSLSIKKGCFGDDDLPGPFFYLKEYITDISLLHIGNYSSIGLYAFLLMFKGFKNIKQPPKMPEGVPLTGKGCYKSMFLGCIKLNTVPKLNHLTLSESCYLSMFKGCISLTVNRSFDAKTMLAKACCKEMFSGCTNLSMALGFNAKEMKPECYSHMFYECENLTFIDKLPAMILALSCYLSMFEGCVKLKSAPELPAVDLLPSCYKSMFKGCTFLLTTCALPAILLLTDCYKDMFASCGCLKNPPKLPALQLVSGCYNGMFQDTSINKLDVSFKQWVSGCTNNWTKNVSEEGTFYGPLLLPHTLLYRGESYIPFYKGGQLWKLDEGLTFRSSINDFTIKVATKGNPQTQDLYYKYRSDSKTTLIPWEKVLPNQVISIKKNKVIYFKNLNTKLSTSEDDYVNFKIDGLGVVVSGSLTALLNGKGVCSNYCFYSLFENNRDILFNISLLLFSSLGDYCFARMFAGCTMRILPALPTYLSLKRGCYKLMFCGCTISNATGNSISLGNITEVESIYVELCFYKTFYQCKGLVFISGSIKGSFKQDVFRLMFYLCPQLLSADISIDIKDIDKYGCAYMFAKCSSLKFVSKVLFTGTIEQYGCYEMFAECPNLQQFNALKITANIYDSGCCRMFFSAGTLANLMLLSLSELDVIKVKVKTSACKLMFYKSGIRKISFLLTLITSGISQCLKMFALCSELYAVTGYILNNTSGYTSPLSHTKSYYQCFKLCSSLQFTPVIKLNNIGLQCCYLMFAGCSNLTQVKDIDITGKIGKQGCYRMFANTCSMSMPELFKLCILSDTILLSGCHSMFIESALFLKKCILDINIYNIKKQGCKYMFKACPLNKGNINLKQNVGLEGCFLMFKQCTLDKTSIQLDITGVDLHGCEFMFQQARSYNFPFLVSGKILGVVGLFGCSNMFNMSDFGWATSAALQFNLGYFVKPSDYSFYCMFQGCKLQQVITPMQNSSWILAPYCCSHMFSDCVYLETIAGGLYPTKLALCCYLSMFLNCYSLTAAPELPATTLVSGCYQNMFSGCRKLSSIEGCMAEAWGSGTSNWVSGVAPKGTFCGKKLLCIYDSSHIPNKDWKSCNCSDSKSDCTPKVLGSHSTGLDVSSKTWVLSDLKYTENECDKEENLPVWRLRLHGVIYASGDISKNGKLSGLPSNFKSPYRYLGHMVLLMGYRKPDGTIVWP